MHHYILEISTQLDERYELSSMSTTSMYPSRADGIWVSSLFHLGNCSVDMLHQWWAVSCGQYWSTISDSWRYRLRSTIFRCSKNGNVPTVFDLCNQLSFCRFLVPRISERHTCANSSHISTDLQLAKSRYDLSYTRARHLRHRDRLCSIATGYSAWTLAWSARIIRWPAHPILCRILYHHHLSRVLVSTLTSV